MIHSIKQLFFYFLSIFFFISCASDEEPSVHPVEVIDNENSNSEETIDDDSLEVKKEKLMELITESSSNSEQGKTWRISSAVLTNSFGSINISNNTNILDDEFSINSSTTLNMGTIVWKKRKGINANATSSENVADDNYYSPDEIEFSINDELEIVMSPLKLSQKNETTLVGEIILDLEENSKLEVTLIEKQPGDYKIPPSTLNFKTFIRFNNATSNGATTGFTASYKTNSLYLSYRWLSSFGRVRRVYKYDIITKVLDSTEILLDGIEFTSSRLHSFADELIIVGSGRVSRVNNNLDSNVISYPYNNLPINGNLSRAGTAFVNSQIYVLGGDLTRLGDPLNPFKIRKINNSNELEDIFVIEESRIAAEGDIVDSRLFVFGGYVDNSTRDILNTAIEYNLLDKTFSHIDLPIGISHTSACRNENLIYFAGKTQLAHDELNYYFGVFDTHSRTFTEPEITFESLDLNLVQIEAMTVLDDILYLTLVDKSTSKMVIESVNIASF